MRPDRWSVFMFALTLAIVGGLAVVLESAR